LDVSFDPSFANFHVFSVCTVNGNCAAIPERKNSDLNTTEEQIQEQGGRERGKESSELENNKKMLADQAIIRDLNMRQRQGEYQDEEQGDADYDQVQSIWPFSIEDEATPTTADFQRAVEAGQEQGVRKGGGAEGGEGEEDFKGQGVGQSPVPHPTTVELISGTMHVAETVAADLNASSDKELLELPSPHTSDVSPSPQTSDMSPSPHTSDVSPSPHTSDVSPSPHTSDVSPSQHTSDVSPSQHTSDVSPSPHTGAVLVSMDIISSEIPAAQHAAIVETKEPSLADRRRNRKEKREEAEREKEKEDKNEKGNGPEHPILKMSASASDIAGSTLGDMDLLKLSGVRALGDVCVGKCLESVDQLRSHLAMTCAEYEKRIADLVRGDRASRLKKGLYYLPVSVSAWISMPFFVTLLVIYFSIYHDITSYDTTRYHS
jgi:hypothetical protein